MSNYCATHQREKLAVDCPNCGGEGVSHHDCGDDCCVCLDAEDNVTCDICRGRGSLVLCPTCAPSAFEDYP
jgi:hypothetical protein